MELNQFKREFNNKLKVSQLHWSFYQREDGRVNNGGFKQQELAVYQLQLPTTATAKQKVSDLRLDVY